MTPKLLTRNPPLPVVDELSEDSGQIDSAFRFGICAVALVCIFIAGCNHAFAYTDEQIVKAIYLAEGGKNAQFPYGIRSVECSSEGECRKICANTVRNNRKRWQKQGSSVSFLQFMASRYCPINASNDRAGVNKFWLKNVTYFLRKGVA